MYLYTTNFGALLTMDKNVTALILTFFFLIAFMHNSNQSTKQLKLTVKLAQIQERQQLRQDECNLNIKGSKK